MNDTPGPFGFDFVEDERKNTTVKTEEMPQNLFSMFKKHDTEKARANSVNQLDAFTPGESSVTSKTEPFRGRQSASTGFFARTSIPAHPAPAQYLFGRQSVVLQPSIPVTSAQNIPKKFLIPKSKLHSPVKTAEEGENNPVPAIAFRREPRVPRNKQPTMKVTNNELMNKTSAISEHDVEENTATEHAAARSAPKEPSILNPETAGQTPQAFTTNPQIGLDPTHTCFVCERPFFDPRQPQQPDTSMWPSVSMTIDAIRSLIVLTIIIAVFLYPDQAHQARNAIVEDMQHAMEDMSRVAGICFDGMEVWLGKVEAVLSALWLSLSGLIGR